jgi:sugar diacid utilization regulator
VAAFAREDLGGPVIISSWQDGTLVVRTSEERLADDPLDSDRVAKLLPEGATAGLGTSQHGPEGLRRTASQASAAARRGTGRVVPFDRLGVHAVLAELAGSDSAVMAARDMLAPLGGLGFLAPHALPTLKAYLDTWGSRTRAAEILHLHPNAVAHRIRRISEALDLDLADPATRFALQLACHVLTALPGDASVPEDPAGDRARPGGAPGTTAGTGSL